MKNYIFDLGNVVLILNWDKALEKYKELNEEEINILRDKVFESEEWLKLDEGVISKPEAIKIMENAVPDKLKKYCSDIMETWTDGLIINNEIVELIKSIKEKGYNTYVLSNAPLDIDKYLKDKNLNTLFDGIILSAFEKLVKPNKAIYELILDRFDLDPKESVFIDDKLENVQAAKNAGIEAFQFDYKDIKSLKEYINL